MTDELFFRACDLRERQLCYSQDKRHNEIERAIAKQDHDTTDMLLKELKRVERENADIKHALQKIAEFISKEEA